MAGSSNPAPPQPAPKPQPPPAQNPALRMMGLPRLPRKLPSRNWLIFWAVTGALTSAIVYDKREKNRATAKWRRVVAPLALEPMATPNQLPRKLTIFLEAPPGDGLRVAQDHFIEYAKPVLAASGLDWEFVQGRQQGDVRAAVAEKIRRARRAHERPGEPLPSTADAAVEEVRKKMALPEYEGVKGDLVFGLHTWKEYVRGLHEGWLGPLDPPPSSSPNPGLETGDKGGEKPALDPADGGQDGEDAARNENTAEDKEKKADRPAQPPPYNSVDDYSSAHLPPSLPSEFDPVAPIPFPHRLGIRHTLVRLGRFLSRRKLADRVGGDVAAVCFAAAREFREADGQYEQQLVLQHEEADWPTSVWKHDEEGEKLADEPGAAVASAPPKEKIWASPIVADARLAQRMRRFELQPDVEARAAQTVVPEEDVEGWIKGSLRSLWRWGVSSWDDKPKPPNVGNIDEEP